LFQLFDHLKEVRGVDILNKVHPIAGDVSEPNLAISESDRGLLTDTVEIVYHAAATIRFDEALRKAVLLNTRGTKLVLGLAKEMKKLQVRQMQTQRRGAAAIIIISVRRFPCRLRSRETSTRQKKTPFFYSISSP